MPTRSFHIRSESEREGYTDQMSQELIGIIGAATVAVALAAPVHAQVDSADWNTVAFFRNAEAADAFNSSYRLLAIPVSNGIEILGTLESGG